MPHPKKLILYLDNCCFNRPFDDQMQLSIVLETEAKLFIQSLIVDNKIDLVWSYVLLLENSKNPYEIRKNAIFNFSKFAKITVIENQEIILKANEIQKTGIKAYDSLHLACAFFAHCDYFLTTDKRLLKYIDNCLKVINPVEFITIWEEGRD